MAQTVFNRVEKKYKLSEEKYRQFLERLLYYMEIDQFGKHTINNIYYDTQDDLLIRHSIEKPKYKEKLRLRSYGTPGLLDSVFLEIKKKYNDARHNCFAYAIEAGNRRNSSKIQ